MTRAKLFMTGGSQAVRLLAEFRFEGDEVEIRRDSEGDVGVFKANRVMGRVFRLGANARSP